MSDKRSQISKQSKRRKEKREKKKSETKLKRTAEYERQLKRAIDQKQPEIVIVEAKNLIDLAKKRAKHYSIINSGLKRPLRSKEKDEHYFTHNRVKANHKICFHKPVKITEKDFNYIKKTKYFRSHESV
jgi:hypothetical protein